MDYLCSAAFHDTAGEKGKEHGSNCKWDQKKVNRPNNRYPKTFERFKPVLTTVQNSDRAISMHLSNTNGHALLCLFPLCDSYSVIS